MTPRDERYLPRDPVSVVSPGTYCVSDTAGDVAGTGEDLFYKDTRHLSRLIVRVDGRTLAPQSTRVQGSTAEFSLVAPGGVIRATWRRELGGGMREETRLKNDSSSPVEVRVETCRIALALLAAGPHFDHRLPEVFAEYSWGECPAPVPYPTSCSPQAWVAGAMPLLLRAMLGVEPEPRERQLLVDPALPEGVSVELSGIPAFRGRRNLRG